MKTRRADIALRLGLIVVGLAGLVVFFALISATEGWSPLLRIAVLLPPGGVTFLALIAGAELREPFAKRTRYGARRRGEQGGLDLGDEFRRRERAAASPAGGAPTGRFGIRPRNTRVAVGITAVTTMLLFAGGLDTARRAELTDAGAVAIFLLAPSLWLLARSIVRLATASRAIRLDERGITFGAALGFAPPVRVPRAEVAAVVEANGTGHALHFLVGPDTGYRVRTDHLEEPEGLLAWLRTWWPEVPVADLEAGPERPPTFEELAPPSRNAPPDPLETGDTDASGRSDTDTTGAAPPRDRILLARRTLRRRAVLAGSLFLVAFAGMYASGWWYLSQRAANDRLVTDGIVVAATVVDVNRSYRGPDTLDVAFDHDGVEHEHTISSGFFSGFSPDARGDRIDVLLDPVHPNLVRLPDRRNIHELTWIALLGAGAAGLIGALWWATTLQHRSTLDIARWARRRIHATPKTGPTPAALVLEGDAGSPPLVLRGAGGLGKRTLDSAPSWVGTGKRSVVVLPDAPADLTLTAALPKAERRGR